MLQTTAYQNPFIQLILGDSDRRDRKHSNYLIKDVSLLSKISYYRMI